MVSVGPVLVTPLYLCICFCVEATGIQHKSGKNIKHRTQKSSHTTLVHIPPNKKLVLLIASDIRYGHFLLLALAFALVTSSEPPERCTNILCISSRCALQSVLLAELIEMCTYGVHWGPPSCIHRPGHEYSVNNTRQWFTIDRRICSCYPVLVPTALFQPTFSKQFLNSIFVCLLLFFL